MEIYFDNAASTRVLEDVAEKMTDIMLNYYANPAANGAMGMGAEKIINESRKKLANIICCQENEIYFTSGGTEGNNWAIFGTAKGYYRSGKHIITTKIEHPAVLEPFRILEKNGFEVTYLDVDEQGVIDLKQLENSIRQDTILISVMFVNNEIGTIQPIQEIGELIKIKNQKALFHVDAVQGFGKVEINVQKSKIDLLSNSAHKFHGPKGVGMFYMRNGLKVKPLFYGGGHQSGMRSGTENTAGCAALCLAAEKSYQYRQEHHQKVLEIKQILAEGILNTIEGTKINGANLEKASPYILNISFDNIRSEVLLNALSDKGIFVSAGSACNSKHKAENGVLKAIGKASQQIEGAIRFSFSQFNTVEQAHQCLQVLQELVPMLRRYYKKR